MSITNKDAASSFLQENVNVNDSNKTTIFVLPCTDIITTNNNNNNNNNNNSSSITIGNGVIYKDDKIVSIEGGKLNYSITSSSCQYSIKNNKKYYIPRTGDNVIGIIEEKGTDYYKVNIFSGANSIALLGRLAFEGATKRNKPELKKGDIVYARITMTNKDIDTELTCLSNTGSKKEWTTNETIYGELSNGLLIHLSNLSIVNTLLVPDCTVLNSLGKHFAFEVAIGMNGLIWIRSQDNMITIIIRNAILNSQYICDNEVESMVDELAKLYSKKSMKR